MAAAAREGVSSLAVYSIACLVACEALLFFLLPRGFSLGGQRLDITIQLALLAAALAAGAWGALGATARRAALGGLAAALLLTPAYDPRAPVERLPGYLAAAALLLLHVEFGLLHARVARLSAMPRAHLTQVGQQREVELSATAGRIAASWPTPLALAAALIGACLALQLGLGAIAPAAIGQSIEMRGPFGLGLAAVLLMGGLGLYVALVRLPRERATAPAREDEGATEAEGPSAPVSALPR